MARGVYRLLTNASSTRIVQRQMKGLIQSCSILYTRMPAAQTTSERTTMGENVWRVTVVADAWDTGMCH